MYRICVALLSQNCPRSKHTTSRGEVAPRVQFKPTLDTGAWTIIVTRPDGVSCAVAAGEAWLEETALSAAPPA